MSIGGVRHFNVVFGLIITHLTDNGQLILSRPEAYNPSSGKLGKKLPWIETFYERDTL